jgi:hypothetical protein
MDEEEKTKNTLSFEEMGLENPTVVISTVTMEVRSMRFPFVWDMALHHWMTDVIRFGRQRGCLMLKSSQCP